ncbi:MAG: hypothetical protein JRN06_01900 [Nitrososphaerota archaeon]|nr:hypothetical protein [Nitrososphaerota archaeon]MDG7023392.1 hypothetical protein [Nitrososphaerota archaeon]
MGGITALTGSSSAKVEYVTTSKGCKYLETYGALLQTLSDDRGLASESYAQTPERR